MFEILNKNAVVTGGAGGIGLEICRSLLEKGLKNLAIFDVTGENVVETLKNDYPQKVIIFRDVDVSTKDSIKNAFNEIKIMFEQLHIVINCAAIYDDRQMEKTLLVNIGGVMNCSLSALSVMTTENSGDGGVIINISSAAGLGPQVFFMPIYSASKYAVIGFTRCMSQNHYYEKTGVRFALICPGITTTTLGLNYNEKLIFLEDRSIVEQNVMEFSRQPPSVVSECTIKALESGKNGSVWLSMGGNNSEIELDEHHGIK